MRGLRCICKWMTYFVPVHTAFAFVYSIMDTHSLMWRAFVLRDSRCARGCSVGGGSVGFTNNCLILLRC